MHENSQAQNPVPQPAQTRAGEATYSGDFLGHWAHELLFYDGPAWVFTIIYAAFGLLVVTTFVLAPPRRRHA